MTVFFIHSVVGGEINDESHVQWLLSRVRSFCLWRSNTRQFPADMTTLVFSAKKIIASFSTNSDYKRVVSDARDCTGT